MRYTKPTADTFVLVLDQDDLFIASLQEFCTEQKIANGHFTGIGAVRDITCGYYDLENREYHFSEYPDLVEVVSLTGNIMYKDDAPFVHAHGVFSDTKNQTFGGHIQEMAVGVTLEITLQRFATNLVRTYDENTGLYLIDTGSDT